MKSREDVASRHPHAGDQGGCTPQYFYYLLVRYATLVKVASLSSQCSMIVLGKACAAALTVTHGHILRGGRSLISTSNNSDHAPSPAVAITPPNNEYARYLQSSRWRNLAFAVRLRAKGKCEICRRADGVECAHLTYERIFHEPIDDLLWLCRKCHRELDQNR